MEWLVFDFQGIHHHAIVDKSAFTYSTCHLEATPGGMTSDTFISIICKLKIVDCRFPPPHCGAYCKFFPFSYPNLPLDTIPWVGYHVRMQDQKTRIVKHLKIIEGQVRGLQQMVSSDTYCIDVITQTSAIKQSLSNIEDALLRGHISHCVVDQIKAGHSETATEEILKVYKLKRK